MSKASARRVKKDLEKWRIKQEDNFDKRLTKVCKLSSEVLQRKINGRIDKPTPFTKNAVGFRYTRSQGQTENRIFIKDIQEKYLTPYFEGGYVTKMQPVAENRKNAYGNIRQLKSKKYVKIKHKNGTEILVDPTKKNGKVKKSGKGKTIGRRLVATLETNKRNAVLDSWIQNEQEIVRMVRNRMKFV